MATPTQRAFRGRVLYRVLITIAFFVRRIPLSAARTLGRFLGRLGWLVLRRERRKAFATISRAFPAWPHSRHRDTLHAMFLHLGVSVMEFLWLPNLDRTTIRKTTVYENEQPTLDLIDQGRGVVVFTAHCGNWEWMAFAVGLLGRPTSVIQRERDEPEMNRLITETRGRSGVRTIDRGSPSSTREMLASIRRGGILAFLIDHNIRAESAKVPFFAIPALTPIGPARLAIRTEAIAVTIFTERRADGIQVVRFGNPIECRKGDDPIALTARMTAEIEAQIRRAPEQWVWMHERWRERPQWDIGSREASGDGDATPKQRASE